MMVGGDNFHVEVRGETREHFAYAVKMAFENAPGNKASHYITDLPEGECPDCFGRGKQTRWISFNDRKSVELECNECGGTGKSAARSVMILFWEKDTVRKVQATKLPFALNAKTAVDFLWSWLENATYPEEPDHDGSNHKGFIVTTGDFWGHIEGSHYTVLAVYPDWQMYGK